MSTMISSSRFTYVCWVCTVQTIFALPNFIYFLFASPLFLLHDNRYWGSYMQAFSPFVMNIEIVLSGLDYKLCFCSSCNMMICRCTKMSVLIFFNQSCLYIMCDMIHVIHGNTITFIVIVIVMAYSASPSQTLLFRNEQQWVLKKNDNWIIYWHKFSSNVFISITVSFFM